MWTSAEIAAATDGAASSDFVVSGVTFDSREVGPGDLFIALSGEATDGHRYLDQAFARGAAGAIVSEPCAHPHVRVADTMAALEALGRAGRDRSAARIVGVTGSVGKTGTKEALFAALDRNDPGCAHRSVKSYNNHTGVPLSLARMPRDARFGIFEMGMNHAGELAALTRMVRPHVAIVTAIAPAHAAYFTGEEAIADAKGEIFQGLEPGGFAIVPQDSPHRDRLVSAAAPHAARVATFGIGDGADIRALETMPSIAGGSFVSARLGTRELTFTVRQPGAHWVSNALAIIGAVDAVGGDLALAGLALADMGGLPGRGQRFVTPVDGGTAVVIDESYNANPSSMRATLAVLGQMDANRRIAVLGEMRELGEGSDAYHAALSEPIVAARVELAILVGEAMAALGQALEKRVEFVHVADAATARDRLMAALAPGDAVLIKGSNAVGLSGVVAALAGGGAAAGSGSHG
nr:UDP-N-acetylmuramoyl-tripeptide--D-alanyl-D-alanine ligase [Sphingomonas japonica]